jgi:hypothetical protein
MANTYTAITKPDGNWWIGWIEEVPGVNCQEPTREQLLSSLRATLQEPTREQLLSSLRATLQEALEFNREEAIAAAASDFTEEQLTI